MKMRFFDFEVFPKWWCIVYGDMPDDESLINENIKQTFNVVTSKDTNCREKCINALTEEGYCISGYNIKRYDLVIAYAIYQGLTPEQVKIVNDMIINPGCIYSTKEHIRLSPMIKKKLQVKALQDLMDDNDGSLKEKEAILGLNILESNVPFNKEDLTDEDIEDIIYYCKHDVYAAMYYFNKVMKGYVKTKLAMGKTFNIPEEVCYKSTNAGLVAKALGAKRASFSDAEKIEIELPKKIDKYVRENLPFSILDYITKNTSGLSLKLFNNDVDFGNGGIHSVYSNNMYVEEDEEYCLLNDDAASYYPSMLIQFNLLSRTVEVPTRYSDIYKERLYLKHKKDKTEADEDRQTAFKLVLNTTFGASGNKYLDLYDPYQCTKCCRVGQLFLAAFSCKLIKAVPQLKIIQTNTDGTLLYFPRKYMSLVQELSQEWSDISGINMEQDHIKKIWQRDVNNYLLVKEEDGKEKVKRKGLWLMDTWTKPGYFLISPLTAYISQTAAQKFLLEGKDIVDTILSCNDILQFAMTCKKGPTYRGVIQKFADGTEKELYKCNRVIATKDSYYGMLYKIKMYKDKLQYTKMPSIPEHCMLINEALDTYNFNEIKKTLDYMFYIQRSIGLLDIPWMELKHSDFSRTNKFDYEI